MASYDTWKAREPDEDAREFCEFCGHPLTRQRRYLWLCERCDEPDKAEPLSYAEEPPTDEDPECPF